SSDLFCFTGSHDGNGDSTTISESCDRIRSPGTRDIQPGGTSARGREIQAATGVARDASRSSKLECVGVHPRFHGHLREGRPRPCGVFLSKRRKTSAESQRGAAEQASPSGVSCAQVARELGIRDTLLTRWKREAQSQGKVAFGGTGTPRDEELARLKRELARVKKERDFLREAATFFAKGSS